MWYKVRLNPECGAHSSSTLLKSQGRHDARLLLRIWQVFDSVRPSQVTSSVILQPCRWSLIVIDVRPTTKDKRCTALPFRLSWPVSALHFMAIMSCTNLSCTSIQPTNEQMGACCVASRAHVRLGLKHRSSFIRKLCSVRALASPAMHTSSLLTGAERLWRCVVRAGPLGGSVRDAREGGDES